MADIGLDLDLEKLSLENGQKIEELIRSLPKSLNERLIKENGEHLFLMNAVKICRYGVQK